MATLEQAKEILKALGLPPAQQTDIAAYTLLALAGLGPRASWSSARRESAGVHDLLQHMAKIHRKRYAENTRETVRRQVIHQMEQARVVDRNPDEPSLSTNSPRTHYALSEDALKVIRSYGTARFASAAAVFTSTHGSLLAVYTARRNRELIPVTLRDGTEISLSPGKHNELQVLIIENFAPQFAPGALLLYMGDTAQKTLHLERDELERLGVPITKHDKLPDVVLYQASRNWLFLVEAVTSHGPVSPKRHRELEQVLADCVADRVYVSAFLDFAELKRHINAIAWETEVWVAENPTHLIHFNGDKFLGPAKR